MCGIGGILKKDLNSPVEPGILEKMNRVLAHRGPDATRIWSEGPIGFLHLRLSIIDLSEQSNQPFFSHDRRYSMVFNGEIYNYKELKVLLEGKGHVFYTHSDTEVLLNLYIEEGEKCLDRLNGMFAFAIWDFHNQELFIARDRVGVKPFYYTETPELFAFASEQKALFQTGLAAEIDPAKLDELLLFRFVAGEDTLFKNVKRLLPGHYAKIKNGRLSIVRWWKLSEQALKVPSISNPFEWFKETFDSSLRYRMISDVPVGVLLSGGLDSSSVAASISLQGYKDISSFTVVFDQPDYNEGPLAKLVAEKFGLKYHQLLVKSEYLLSDLQESSWFHDEPLAHQNDAHLYAIARYAKQHVTVLLSGEGSDELMAGYVRYKPLQYYKQLSILKPFLRFGATVSKRPRLEKLSSLIKLAEKDQVIYNSCNFYPKDLQRFNLQIAEYFPYREKVYTESKELYPDSTLRQGMYLDQHTFMCSLLDRNDRMTMGASIECREPFLDYRLIEGIATLPDQFLTRGRKGKHLLYNTFGKKLPPEVQQFKKWGFGIPWGDYFRSNTVFQARLKKLHQSELFEMGILASLDIKKLTEQYVKGDKSSEILIRQLFMMEVWYDTYFSRLKS